MKNHNHDFTNACIYAQKTLKVDAIDQEILDLKAELDSLN